MVALHSQTIIFLFKLGKNMVWNTEQVLVPASSLFRGGGVYGDDH